MPEPAQVTLPSDREVRVTRRFNAPRQLVYDAHTQAELVRKWMVGYPGWDMPVCEMDVRAGGKYRWQWKSQEDGSQFGFFGTYTEVNAPARVAHEENYDPGNSDIGGSMPAGDSYHVSFDLEEASGVTTLVCTMKYPSKEARDGAVATGMTDGMEFNYAILDDLLKEAA